MYKKSMLFKKKSGANNSFNKNYSASNMDIDFLMLGHACRLDLS
jgi:hypothetical protein